MIDLTKTPLNEEQIEIMTILRVPLYRHFETGQSYIAKGYWHSIKPALQEALIRVVDGARGADHE